MEKLTVSMEYHDEFDPTRHHIYVRLDGKTLWSAVVTQPEKAMGALDRVRKTVEELNKDGNFQEGHVWARCNGAALEMT